MRVTLRSVYHEQAVVKLARGTLRAQQVVEQPLPPQQRQFEVLDDDPKRAKVRVAQSDPHIANLDVLKFKITISRLSEGPARHVLIHVSPILHEMLAKTVEMPARTKLSPHTIHNNVFDQTFALKVPK